jgi:hypothetical protein
MLCAVVLLAFTVPVIAQESTPSRTTIQAGYGTVTMGGVQWQRFSFRPDIPLGKFGLGLDLELFIDNNGKISKEGWDFSSQSKTWETILRKIYYVRYGKREDPYYARAGALDDVTLGYGLIMDGYRNSLNYPADKKLGLQFGVRDIGTFGLGIEGVVNSFGDLRHDGAVVGARVSARPLKQLEMPLASKLTFGITAVRDINQFAGLKDSDDDGYPDFQDGFPDDDKLWMDTDRDGSPDYIDKNGVRTNVDPDADGDGLTDAWWTDGVNHGFDNDVKHADLLNIEDNKNGVTVYGFDVGVPLLEGPLQLDLYGQYSKIHTGDDTAKGGWGIGAPGLQLLFSRFTGRLEYRHFEGRFRPGYFNNLYENERVFLIGNTVITKEMSLPDVSLDGVYGLAAYNFFDYVTARATYQNMTGDKTYQDLTGSVGLTEKLLSHVPKISLVEGYYYNTYVDTDTYNLFDLTSNTLYGTRIGIQIAPSLTIVWDTRYTFTPNGRGGFERHRFVGIETVMAVR